MVLMGKHDDARSVFPLTSLQIGDLQAYLSDLSLYLAIESNKFYILVDNRPWLRDLDSRPAHLWWQLMVTKSRLSPFANTKGRREKKEGKEASSESNAKDSKKLERWFCSIDAAMLSEQRVLLPVKKLRTSLLLSSELHRTLYGFIVFEVTWSNVRGINYLNELQTDTSLAIEAKSMQRWEFDSIDQAANSISSWFSGTFLERCHLKVYLDSTTGEVFHDTEEDFDEDNDDGNIYEDSFSTEENFLYDHSGTSDLRVYPTTGDCETFEPQTPIGPYKRKNVTKATSTGVEVDLHCEETQRQAENSSDNSTENAVEATEYRDVLLLFRFDDRDLPFKLQQIITPDLRLLRLLEAGLPSWVLFLQSYPGFCHIYRPWMCPLARALYVLISVITVVIGFYDLYKNVPVLKATAARLCGPLFDWIETWEMVSRIKYLGTMLFLHNCQKAVRLFLTFTRATRSFFSFLCLPLAEPFMDFLDFLLPIWNLFSEVVESFFSVIWIVICALYSLVEDLIEIVLMPICFIGLVLQNLATSVLCPVFWILWEIIYAPIRLFLGFARFVAFICFFISRLVGDIWQSFRSIIQFASATESAVSSNEISMWRSLWNDIFSQVFRALRSILNGFVAFFAACNRHRLSIYNHARHFVQRPFGGATTSQTSDPRRSKSAHGNMMHPHLEIRRRVHGKSCPPALSF
ncbi:hypothetical protein ERO13_A07G082500v2 [Gossypium hirsutum]|uniref:G1/S-specific cyclin-E protein n=1 Tax=Gossypium hirsutum TaxID=3635 RepID=A0A1U8MFN4_GOSHI|nr:uncharacterized protein LOC107937306 [Gossypium hirsutum]XP_016725659.2 uncharacterized protein LOC107937306 [Gossypium hirsutum]KAG4191298.1 hypothetical protein ERO13_A07G082500v2 [Gossypium hirsutum]KAG4191299.1 hypothetical protein ERO13_A07G082500v2 [Gossypium hirsutum]KAG4191300.1 hypothetical protein ERO13_A07G082500v2 [Gossypium hirsutum]